jgi:dTDP-4-amino-4,6-dideoxygalactose transaminase
MSQLAHASDGPDVSGVPFLDLTLVNAVVHDEVMAGLERLFETNAFTNGADVGAFEELFAAYCGTAHSVGLSSGLDALRLALLAGGIERGDEVIVPANTFVATFEAVTQAGAVPVVADVSEADYNLDPQAVDALAGPRARFVLPVHLYGQLADMRAILPVAERHGLTIVEDAAQAHGAMRDGIRAGAGGHAAAFSFYPAKNLGAFGDAGALTTDDPELAARVRALREHGQTVKYRYAYEGYTARLDTFQAIVLSAKLARLDAWNERRRAIAREYGEALAGVGDLTLPPVAAGSDPVWHLYVVRTSEPDALAAFLAQRGIGTGRHYPEPPHLSEAYRMLGYQVGSFPVTEAICREGLSLPIFPGMTSAQLGRVSESVRAYFDRG